MYLSFWPLDRLGFQSSHPWVFPSVRFVQWSRCGLQGPAWSLKLLAGVGPTRLDAHRLQSFLCETGEVTVPASQGYGRQNETIYMKCSLKGRCWVVGQVLIQHHWWDQPQKEPERTQDPRLLQPGWLQGGFWPLHLCLIEVLRMGF